MVTWMEHPKHGRHPAVGGEIDGLKANGWTICAPKKEDGIADPIKMNDTERVKRKYVRKI